MNKKLYELYKNYNVKELDDYFINTAFEIMMEDEKKLKHFINDFIIIHNSENSNLGTFDNNNRVITINKDNIINGNDNISHKKIQTLRVIRHELEHARNIEILHKCHNDIESAIIKLSLKKYAVDHGLDYYDRYDKNKYTEFMYYVRKKANYLIDPEERLVDIKAWKYMVNLLKNNRYSSDLLLARSNLYYAYMRGYQDNGYYIDAPTYQFLLKMGMYHEYYLFKKRVEEEKDYSFNTRLTYGLPLKNSEYDTAILNKVKLKKIKI